MARTSAKMPRSHQRSNVSRFIFDFGKNGRRTLASKALLKVAQASRLPVETLQAGGPRYFSTARDRISVFVEKAF
jgi:hypothetical protein